MNNTPEKISRKIYISGPMTGIAGFNFPAFDAAQQTLEASGWSVIVSPAEISRKNGVTPDSTVDGKWLRQLQEEDISALLTCKAIYMLKGWRKSKGANAEFQIAKWLGLEIQFEEGADEGVDPKGEAGQKKAPLWLLPAVALEEAAWVHKLGVDKYGPWNWRKTSVKASTYISAIMRHLILQWATGQDTDAESGRSHLAHVIACCNILLDAQKHGCLADDRTKSPAKDPRTELLEALLLREDIADDELGDEIRKVLGLPEGKEGS